MIPYYLRQATKGGSLVVHNSGTQTRDFVYLDDVVNALVQAGKASDVDEATVNIGSGREISILDLREYRAETDDKDLQMVYENLLRASRNHLRIFAAQLQDRGETYERAHLGQNLFDEIVSTPPEAGFDAEEPVE